ACRSLPGEVRHPPRSTQRGSPSTNPMEVSMSTTATLDPRAEAVVAPSTFAEKLRDDPAYQAFLLLRIAFTVAPILFGLEKFANVMTDDWTKYLSSDFNSLLPGSAATGM